MARDVIRPRVVARPLRILARGLTYHVFARGNARMNIFLDDADHRKFLDLFGEVVSEFDIECHAYCMMRNHYHAVLTTRDANLSRAMHALDGEYAQWFNRRYSRVGHVLHGRFGSKIVQNDTYLLTVCKYVVRNPLRSELVQSPGDWPWSSYRATAGLAPVPPFLEPDVIWMMLGDSPERRATLRYQEFIATPGGDSIDSGSPIAIGDPAFVNRFENLRRRADRKFPRRAQPSFPSLEHIFTGALTRAARNGRLVIAVRMGHSRAAIAQFLQMHVSSINKILAAVGDGCQSDDARATPKSPDAAL